ncbi:MAG TPA: STAS domain-containing protein [Acidobacteriaceae bacterium]|jgi:anti-anti-sigma regulatory factor
MTTGKRTVIVKQLPSSPDLEQNLIFFQEVQGTIAERRPCLVLDCSLLRELDEATIHLMLHCLEEVLKRNGDLKLSGLPPHTEAAFAAARLERLFDVYDTAGDAVASFNHTPMSSAPGTLAVLQPAEAA